MGVLITRWRRMVNDDAATIWADDDAQQMLDSSRRDFYAEPLQIISQEINNVVEYKVYESRHENLEQSTSGESAWRLYTSTGVTVTATHTIDYINGVIRFTSDQQAATYYLDGRSYDLHCAAASAWRERAADVAGYYSFGADGGNWSRSDWFKHCDQMAMRHDALSRPMQPMMLRLDTQ
jgi:hypothetical protein